MVLVFVLGMIVDISCEVVWYWLDIRFYWMVNVFWGPIRVTLVDVAFICRGSPVPKCDFSMMRRKYLSTSFLKSLRFGLPGLGTKFRFLFRSLNSFFVKLFPLRFITYLYGSSMVLLFSLLTDFCKFANSPLFSKWNPGPPGWLVFCCSKVFAPLGGGTIRFLEKNL